MDKVGRVPMSGMGRMMMMVVCKVFGKMLLSGFFGSSMVMMRDYGK